MKMAIKEMLKNYWNMSFDAFKIVICFFKKLINVKILFVFGGLTVLSLIFINATTLSSGADAYSKAKLDPIFNQYRMSPNLPIASQADADKMNALIVTIAAGLNKDFENGSNLKIANITKYRPGEIASDSGMIYFGLKSTWDSDSNPNSGYLQKNLEEQLDLGVQVRLNVIPESAYAGEVATEDIPNLSEIDNLSNLSNSLNVKTSAIDSTINWLKSIDGSVLQPILVLSATRLGGSDLFTGSTIIHEGFHIFSSLDKLNNVFNLGSSVFYNFSSDKNSFQFVNSNISIYKMGFFFDEVPARIAEAGFLLTRVGDLMKTSEMVDMDDMFTGALQLLNSVDLNSGVYSSFRNQTYFSGLDSNGSKWVTIMLPGDRRKTAAEDFDLMKAQCIYGTNLTRDIVLKYYGSDVSNPLVEGKRRGFFEDREEIYLKPRLPKSALKEDANGFTNIDPTKVLTTKKGIEFFNRLNELNPTKGAEFRNELHALIVEATGGANVARSILDFAKNPQKNSPSPVNPPSDENNNQNNNAGTTSSTANNQGDRTPAGDNGNINNNSIASSNFQYVPIDINIPSGLGVVQQGNNSTIFTANFPLSTPNNILSVPDGKGGVILFDPSKGSPVAALPNLNSGNIASPGPLKMDWPPPPPVAPPVVTPKLPPSQNIQTNSNSTYTTKINNSDGSLSYQITVQNKSDGSSSVTWQSYSYDKSGKLTSTTVDTTNYKSNGDYTNTNTTNSNRPISLTPTKFPKLDDGKPKETCLSAACRLLNPVPIPNSNKLGAGTKKTIEDSNRNKTGAVTALPKIVYGEEVND